jgi:hypothetical protein
MLSFCGACGDLCHWAVKRARGPRDGEIVRRVRPGEALYLHRVPEKLPRPRGPGRSAAKRRAETDPSIRAKAEHEKWEASMAEIRDDDVLACFRNSVMPEGYIGDFRFESQAEMECRACTTKGLLRLFLNDNELCPRCHQGPMRNLGLWE